MIAFVKDCIFNAAIYQPIYPGVPKEYRVSHKELIQSKDLSLSDVLINLPKLMLSGFLRCGILCLIHYLKLF